MYNSFLQFVLSSLFPVLTTPNTTEQWFKHCKI